MIARCLIPVGPALVFEVFFNAVSDTWVLSASFCYDQRTCGLRLPEGYHARIPFVDGLGMLVSRATNPTSDSSRWVGLLRYQKLESTPLGSNPIAYCAGRHAA